MSHLYAGLWTRLKAFGIDYLVISLYIMLITGVTLVIQSTYPNLTPILFGAPLLGQVTGFLIMTLPVTLYFALFESSPYQATLGKQWQGLRVIHDNGKRLSTKRAIGRTAIKFIPWELAHTCVWQIYAGSQELSLTITTGLILVWILVGVYIVTLLTSSSRQALYDQLTNTYVIKY